MKKLLLEFWCLACCGLMAYGQEDYYRPVEGLKKSELKTALHELIQPESVLDYGGKGEGYTWSGFVVTDRMPDGTVRDRYSDVVRGFNGLNAICLTCFPVTERPTGGKATTRLEWSRKRPLSTTG